MDKVLEEVGKIAFKYQNISKVMLFGSRARGDNGPVSDYDIAVFSKNLQPCEQTLFLNEIESIETLNKIDIIFIQKRHFHTELYRNIMRDGVEIINKFQIKLNNY